MTKLGDSEEITKEKCRILTGSSTKATEVVGWGRKCIAAYILRLSCKNKVQNIDIQRG